MREIFQNDWFVGIASGIISGISVFVITNIITVKFNDRRNLQHVKIANDEVVARLKSYIVSGGLPEINVLNAMINSIARKNSVQRTDMYTIDVFCEELICEVITDVYISDDEKKIYELLLVNYVNELKQNLTENELRDMYVVVDKSCKKKMDTKNNMVFSILAAFLAMPLSIIAVNAVASEGSLVSLVSIPSKIRSAVLIILIVIFVSSLAEVIISGELSKIIKEIVEGLRSKEKDDLSQSSKKKLEK